MFICLIDVEGNGGIPDDKVSRNASLSAMGRAYKDGIQGYFPWEAPSCGCTGDVEGKVFLCSDPEQHGGEGLPTSAKWKICL